MYTRSELSKFWDSVLVSAASRNALKKFPQKLIAYSNNKKGPGSHPYFDRRTDFLVDNMIPSGYFKHRFMGTFRPVSCLCAPVLRNLVFCLSIFQTHH